MSDLKPCHYCGKVCNLDDHNLGDCNEYLKTRLALAEQVCYALVGQQEHGTAKHRMAVDAALDAWKREAVKGGEG